MIQFHGGGFRVSMSHIRGDNAVAVQILAGDAFQHGLGLRVQLCKAAHCQHGIQSAEQVDGTFHDQDDADGHHQRFHGTEGVCDQDDAQHHAEHRQQQKALPAVVAAAAQVQSVLHPANGVKDDEQAEHDGQNAYHDIAAQQQKNAQCKADKLGISFGGLRAVDRFEVEIKKGQLYGLIGPNGAGKTTVFNMLTGVYKPTDGIIKLDGEDLVGKKTIEINKAGIARTFQNIRLFSQQSVLDNVKIGLHNQYKYSALTGILRLPKYHKMEKEMNEKAMELLKVFELDGKADFLASNLPYGEQRKLEIARALATNPKLLLLDEPAAGMNPNETIELMDTIRFVRDNFDMTVLLIEHDMKLVSGICEELTVLNFGQVLAQGKTKDVLNDPEVIKAYLGE